MHKHPDIPGPGAYGAGSALGGPKWAFSRSERNQEIKESLPGPGTYDIKPSIPDIPSYLNVSVS